MIRAILKIGLANTSISNTVMAVEHQGRWMMQWATDFSLVLAYFTLAFVAIAVASDRRTARTHAFVGLSVTFPLLAAIAHLLELGTALFPEAWWSFALEILQVMVAIVVTGGALRWYWQHRALSWALRSADSVREGNSSPTVPSSHPEAEPETAVRESAQTILRELLATTATLKGDDFFRILTRDLAQKLGVRCVTIAQVVTNVPDRLQTLACWSDNEWQETLEYDMSRTPCGQLKQGFQNICYPDSVREYFPQDRWLERLDARSYLGIPLFDPLGQFIGHLCTIDDKPLEDIAPVEAILNTCAMRASAELHRQWLEEELQIEVSERQRAERSLQNVVAGTALVTGEQFFPALVHHLATALEVSYAIVSEVANPLGESPAFWANAPLESIVERYTPFEPSDSGSTASTSHRDALNPQILGNLNAGGYLRVPLFGSSKQVVGYLFLLDDRPILRNRGTGQIVNVFAARAATELQRKLDREALHRAYDELEMRVQSRTAELSAANQFLAAEIAERASAEAQLQERSRQAALGADVGFALTQGGTLRQVLQHCAEALVQHLDAAFARIWTLNADANELELQASAGMYVHLDGAHSRIRVGEYKIGRIARSAQPHLTNEVQTDPAISDPDWARREQMVAFAGYPLVVDGQVVGVMAVFAKTPLSETTLGAMSAIADGIALGINRKQAEDALRVSQQQLNSILGSLRDAVWSISVKKFGIVYLNPAVEIVYHRPIREFLEDPSLWWKAIYPPDRPRIGRIWRAIQEGKSVGWDLEYRIVLPGGEIRSVRDRAHLVYDAEGIPLRVDSIVTDITERQQYEAALERERQQLRQIVTHAPFAMAMLDTQMCYLAYSNQWLTDYHLEDVDLIGRSHYEIFPDLSPQWQQIYQRALQGEILSQNEEKFELADGTFRYLRWVVQPWYVNSQRILPHDLSAESFSQPGMTPGNTTASVARENVAIGGIAIVTQAIDEWVEAREAALESTRLKSQFLANMSHEIRTPMNGVIGMTDLLLKTNLSSQQKDFVKTLQTSGKNLLILINDILDFSKLEAGEMRLEALEFDLNTCLEDVIDSLAVQAAAKGLEPIAIVEAGVPTALKGDDSRLRQVLMNLVGNAIKFTEEGEVKIRVSLAKDGGGGENSSGGDRSQIKLYFEAIDTGIGISAEGQSKLFQSFSQVDASTTRKYGGTGLGLAICQQIVHLMGGEIGVESVEGQGSTFWFTATFERQDEGGKMGHSTSTFAGKKLLVVSENALNSQALVSYCSAWGMESDIAPSPEAASSYLQNAARTGKPYDLALVDLPNLDRSNSMLELPLPMGTTFDMPWIVAASIHQHQQVKLALERGASGYVLKPLKASRLLETLEDLLPSTDGSHEADRESEDAMETSDVSRAREDDISHLKILLVEDTPVNQKVMLNQLRILGIEADCVANGQEALDRLEREDYDIILMDCLMPVLDGYETTKALRRREDETQHAIVIALTANALKGEREKCLAAGMDDYISKPIEIASLASVLKSWSHQLGYSSEAPSREERVSSEDIREPLIENKPIVDLDKLQQMTGGDPEFERELMEMFLEDAPSILQELKKAAFEELNFTALAERAHQLKGAAAAIAINRMPEVAREIERQARANSLDGIDEWVRELEEILERVRVWAR